MGISFDIIDLESNQVVTSYGIKWLSKYTEGEIPLFDIQDMVKYCQSQIEIIKASLSQSEIRESKHFLDLKSELLSKINSCESKYVLKKTLITFFDEKNEAYNEESSITYNKLLILHFESFQYFLIPYLSSSTMYRSEISC